MSSVRMMLIEVLSGRRAGREREKGKGRKGNEEEVRGEGMRMMKERKVIGGGLQGSSVICKLILYLSLFVYLC